MGLSGPGNKAKQGIPGVYRGLCRAAPVPRRRRAGRPQTEHGTPVEVRSALTAKLTEALAPTRLEVTDDSARHAGHAGARPEGETHFSVTVVSERFRGLGRVARQRLVYDILAEELAGPVHALSLATLTPEEDTRSSPAS